MLETLRSDYIRTARAATNRDYTLIVYSSLSFPSFILSESFLSFLGLGVSALMSSWGSLIDEGVRGMELYPLTGDVPSPNIQHPGCYFYDCCQNRMEKCKLSQPELKAGKDGNEKHQTAYFLCE